MASISKACIELSNSIRGFRLGRTQPDSNNASGVTPTANGGTGGTAGGAGTGAGTGGAGAGPGAGGKGDQGFAGVRGISSGSVSVTTTITRAIKSATSRVKAFDRNGHVPQQQQQQQQQQQPVSPQQGQPPVLHQAHYQYVIANGNHVYVTNGMKNKLLQKFPHLTPVAVITGSLQQRQQQLHQRLWEDDKFLTSFFSYFSPRERCCLAQVCSLWKKVLYAPRFWVGITPVFRCKEWNKDEESKRKFYQSIEEREFDSVCLFGATDRDVRDVVHNFPFCRTNTISFSLRCSNVTDAGLAIISEKAVSVTRLELSGCNEITEAGLWASLNARITALSVSDCINVADDTVGAIAQLMPQLTELSLQAYHVTDAALSFFSAKQSYTMSVLKLQSCWEITNHGIVNVIHSLPNLTVLSLSGCSKITDDGVELIAENLRKLKSLDLSWCPRITDAALEYIACDLGQLEELTLDRCSHITDIGVGYLSTMATLLRLFLRWCIQLRDFGLQHLYTMKNLKVLSLAGCSVLTPSGLTGLVQLRCLDELELTNCPGATKDVCRYLKENLPACLIIE